MSKNNKEYIGSWLAEGSLLIGGYQHGKYSIRMNLSENSSCLMDVRIDTNKTDISEKFTKLIKLEGTWNVANGKIHTDVKPKSWIVTDHADYRKDNPFDDFVATYVFREVNGVLAHGEGYDDSMRLASTEDAGMSLMSKGECILLTCPKFSKFNNQTR